MREIFIERREKSIRIAVKNNNELEECFIEEKSSEPTYGEIYKGRVKNIVPAINSLFLDIGLDKEGYMYYSEDLKKLNIKKGDEFLVEVLKEPLNEKGAKLTNKFNIPGKYLVFTKGKNGISFSKRITDEVKKKLIEAELEEVDGINIVVRTEAVNVPIEILKAERNKLKGILGEMNRKLNYSTELSKVYGEDVSLNKVLRDNITKGNLKIYVDNIEDETYVKSFLDGEKDVEVIVYDGLRTLFDYYNIEKEILKLRHNKVKLNCGGDIVIEKTEAMYVIDVNSGKNIKGRSFDKTILQTNLEAAKEIGKQIMLRNLSGIILIDFIDMRDHSQRANVMKELKDSLKSDKGNSKIYPFTELDLVQITRKRRGKSIYDSIEDKCLLCKGSGNILKLSYIEDLIRNDILRSVEDNTIGSFFIELDNIYREDVKGDLFSFLKNIDGLDKEMFLKFSEGIDGYKIEPLIFKNQKENLADYKVKGIEKY
ncbi:ribonuclease E/G [Clostridium sardiniense]|uniref:ribonuclease E/G n=1 Tax=Clostridium sardiniense TaxID=29369 RepID=UPI001957C07C|nr:ribonuclease E/G [Clostridium sardiniense]